CPLAAPTRDGWIPAQGRDDGGEGVQQSPNLHTHPQNINNLTPSSSPSPKPAPIISPFRHGYTGRRAGEAGPAPQTTIIRPGHKKNWGVGLQSAGNECPSGRRLPLVLLASEAKFIDLMQPSTLVHFGHHLKESPLMNPFLMKTIASVAVMLAASAGA